jgi:hypothetical protein
VIIPDRVAETIDGLRHLAVHPSPEHAQRLIDDWTERQQMYDTTTTGWSRSPREGLLRA